MAEEVEARPAVGREGMPVGRIDEKDPHTDYEEHRRYFDADHDGIERGALLNSLDQDEGQYSNDYYSGKIDIRAGAHEEAVIEAPRAAAHCRRQDEPDFREHV